LNIIILIYKKYKKKYVISCDSDFYFYDVPGYINFKSIDFQRNKNYNIILKKGITYELYTIDILEKHVGFSKNLFPLFATLLGNDYIKRPKIIDNLINKFCNEKNIKYSHKKYIMTEKIIYFLKKCSETTDENKIIDEIFNYISENEDKNKVEEYKNCMNNSLNRYKINQNNSDNNDYSTLLTEEIHDSFLNGKINQKILNSKYYKYIYLYILYVI